MLGVKCVLPLGPGPCRFEARFVVLGVQSGMVCCDQVPSLGLGNRRQIILPGLWREAT